MLQNHFTGHGDNEGGRYFDRLYKNFNKDIKDYAGKLFRGNKADKEDFLQDFYIKLYELCHQQDFQEFRNARAYLLKMVRNSWLDYQESMRANKKKLERYLLDAGDALTATDFEDIPTYKDMLKLRSAAENAIHPIRWREIFCAIVEGEKYAGIAARMGLTSDIVKTQVYLARQAVRKFWEEQCI
ncbi:RNA polymerase sigma factor [Chitinophaga cymbidii]|uniref:RNA polymerase sigma-70 region 2 domain-containing protein n=1 Tax=Chitinophaga cymbidii TaxID=1096750 RepID=A0A512RQ51_9BACT|nr:sigma-70 family RNA polymerase sigma factor [Chitinophaga cymbidii]GEP97821.1 hypothetical protein CCY01nite_40810 [Chitinophaga cymbidii]